MISKYHPQHFPRLLSHTNPQHSSHLFSIRCPFFNSILFMITLRIGFTRSNVPRAVLIKTRFIICDFQAYNKSVCDRLYLSNVSNILSVGKMKHDMWLCNNCDTETNKIYIKTGYGIIIRWWTGARLGKYLSKTHSLKINQIRKTDGVHISDIQH